MAAGTTIETEREGAGQALAVHEQEELNELAALYEKELEAAVKAAGSDLPTWYLGKLAELEALRDALRKQFQLLSAHINHRERALHWKLGAKFQLAVEMDLRRQNAGGKRPKKSVDYLTGRAGFRAGSPSLVIVDEALLRAWCVEHCEGALELKVQRTTPIKDYVKKTGECPPGAEWREGSETFYPRIDDKALAASSLPPQAALPEGGGQ